MADAHPDPLRTALCRRLGMARPVMSSGMGSVAMAPLVAAVSNAGGLGILAGLNLPLAVLESQIAEVRSATDKPFGINLWLHRDLQPPLPPTSLDENLVGQAQDALNRVRATAGMPTIPNGTGLEPAPDPLPEAIELVLAARPAVFSIGLGRPGAELVGRCHERGITVMAMATTVADGLVLADDGVDIIVAQGAEAGGHRSTWEKRPPDTCSVGLVALVPAMVDALGARGRSSDGDTGPAVVAAGGIAASHVTAYVFMFGPSNKSTTSAMPYQLTIAATFSCSVPGH